MIQIVCPECRGTGRVDCPACKDRSEEERAACPVCGGEGKVSCPACMGGGVLDTTAMV